MKLLVQIPKEFESHFLADKFDDSLHRLCADAYSLAGDYERETALMLCEAFKNATIVAQGHWTADSKCSVCGQEPLTDFDVTLMSFCPYCGAIMEV